MFLTKRGKTKGSLLGLVAAATVLAACQGNVLSSARAASPLSQEPGRVGAMSMSGNYLAGRFAQNQQDWATAAEYMSLALVQRPEDVTLARRAYLLSLGAGKDRIAVELGRHLKTIDPNHSIANVMQSIDDARAARFTSAVKRLDGIAADGLTSRLTPVLRAWMMVGRNQGRAALAELQAQKPEKSFVAIYALHAGLIAERNGDTATAARLLEQALAESPTPRLAVALGGLYHRLGQKAKARDVYTRYLDANPGDPIVAPRLAALATAKAPAPLVTSPVDGVGEVLVDVASALLAEGAGDMAQLYAQLARYARPDDGYVNLVIGDVFVSRNQHEAALAYYDAIKPDQPEWWSARLHAASALRRLQRTDEAAAVYESLAVREPGMAAPLIELGHLYRAAARWQDAAAAFDRAAERLPDNDARYWEVHYYRGVALDRSGQSERAETDLMRALQLKPDQPYLLNYVGYQWVERGVRLDEAKGLIERAVALRPNDGYILDSLGWALHRMGQSTAAIEKLERAVELQPGDATINDHLGDVYWAVGRKTEARFQWRRALNQSGDTVQRDELARKIENGLPEPLTAQVGEASAPVR